MAMAMIVFVPTHFSHLFIISFKKITIAVVASFKDLPVSCLVTDSGVEAAAVASAGGLPYVLHIPTTR
jgi:hypothetical protein